MPAVCNRPQVYAVAEYLRERPNQWVYRREIGKHLGLFSKDMESLLVTVCDLFPCIAEQDKYDGPKQVQLMWVDWNEMP
jgi:hypothetical protein